MNRAPKTATIAAARRALVAAGKTAALGVVFALAATTGVLLHIGLPAPRRFATARVNAILDGSFKGKITIQRIGVLGLERLDGIDAEVFDPEGKRVIRVFGLRARLGARTLLRSLVSGGRLVIHVPEVTINGAEILLEEHENGELNLVRTFEPRNPSPSAGGGPEISIPAIHVEHAWVHGHLATAPLIDVDLKGFDGALASTPSMTELSVERLSVRGRGLPGMNPEGAVVGRASLPSDEAGERRVIAYYEGRVGEIPVRASGSLVGKVVLAIVDVPETPPAAFEALAPWKIRLGAAVSAHAEVHGTLPVLEPTLIARVGGGDVTASGVVTLPQEPGKGLVASASLRVKDLDMSVLREGAPRSRLTAAVDATVVTLPGGKLSGTFELQNQLGEMSGHLVPAVSARGAFTERSVQGSAEIAERGAPATVWFALDPTGDGALPDRLVVEAEAVIADLDDIQRLGPIGRGAAHVVASATLDLGTSRVSAKAAVQTFGLDLGGVRLARGRVTVAAEGPLESPRFVANVRGRGMSAGGYAFTDIDARVSGSPEELDVVAKLDGEDSAPTVAARAHVTLRGDVTVRRARVELAREDVKATIDVASILVAGGAVDLRGLSALGLGEPIEATARLAAGGITVKAKTAGVDLSRLAKLVAREEDARGHLAFDVDATASRRAVNGRVEARITDLSVRQIKGGSVQVATSIQGRRVRADVRLSLGDAGRLELSAPEVDLGGSAMELASWTTATGAVAISGTVDLAKLLAHLPEGARPVGAAAGTIAIRGKASRASRSAAHGVELEIATKGLVVVEKQLLQKAAVGASQTPVQPVPWRIAGLDGTVTLKLDASNGRTQVAVKAHDVRGPLVSIDARASLPVAEIWRSPGQLLALVTDLPIDAKIAVPRRSLDALPPALAGQFPVKGEVELTAQLEGTPRAPKLTVNARGTNLLPRGSADCARPVDLAAKVVYDARKADVQLTASREGREVMRVAATVNVDAAAALAGAPLAWEASGDVALVSFPLDVIGSLLHQPIAGSVNGKIAVKDLHRGASLDMNLDLRGVTLDRAQFPNGKVRVTMKDGAVSAMARLDQVDGHAETTATGAVTWGAELAPVLDFRKPIEVVIRAKNFRADAAMPFVQGIFAELDGRIDADARLQMKPGGKDGSMEGALVIRDGIFEVPQIGERFHAVRGRVIMKPWGTLRLEDFYAEAPTGRLTGKADAVLQGLSLLSANASLVIAKGQSIPITIEGVPMGRAYGNITTVARMSQDGKRLDVDVDVPLLHVDLPQSTGHVVQALEPDRTIRIGVHAKRDFAAIPLAAPQKPRAASDLRIRMAIKLGKEVDVKRDTTVHVVASGKPIIEISDKARVTGQIRLLRGKLELQGKQFIIDRGVVSFVGPDPGNPLIIATAYWDGPNGTRVYADFSGHVISGKLSLRSEPALTQDEILSLLLFGAADGSFGAAAPPGQDTSTGIKAAGMAGAFVTQGLNKAFSGITAVDIATRVDTSSDAPRPELAVQITKTISARLGYKVGVPAPGENPDRTELTLDWRFVRNWSLVAVVGDQGSTALDVVWRLRY